MRAPPSTRAIVIDRTAPGSCALRRAPVPFADEAVIRVASVSLGLEKAGQALRSAPDGRSSAATSPASSRSLPPQPSRSAGTAGTDPGPRNAGRDRQNPDLLDPPATDNGTLPNLRFPFADAHMRQMNGRWTRRVTVREPGASKDVAGVNRRVARRPSPSRTRCPWCMPRAGATPRRCRFRGPRLPSSPG